MPTLATKPPHSAPAAVARAAIAVGLALVASACLWVPEGVPVPVTLPADYQPPTRGHRR